MGNNSMNCTSIAWITGNFGNFIQIITKTFLLQIVYKIIKELVFRQLRGNSQAQISTNLYKSWKPNTKNPYK